MPTSYDPQKRMNELVSYIDGYDAGYYGVIADQTDDHMRQVHLFLLRFAPLRHNQNRLHREALHALYHAVVNGRAYISSLEYRGGETVFQLEMTRGEYHRYAQELDSYRQRYTYSQYGPIPSSYTSHPQPIKYMPGAASESLVVPPKVIKKVQTKVETGFRDFKILAKGNQSRPMLLSRNDVPWPRYQPLIASCNGDVFASHDAPHVGCQCGIYAYDKPDHKELKSDANIWGEIALWGKVLVCETGYRAQYAYPQNIFVRDVGTETVRRFRDDLENEYGVPVHLVEKREGKTASDQFAKWVDDFIRKQLKAK